MLPVEGSEILRIAVLSGVLGFAGFCASYGVYVWRKRNAAAGKSRSRTIRLAQLLALLGVAAMALSWAFNEFRGRNGIAGGSDVFVLHARRDVSADQITSAETIAKGDVVAEFLSPADRTRITGIDLQMGQAQAKRNAVQHKVLQTDEALLQEQTHLRSELLQLKGFAFQLRSSQHEGERDRATLLTTWTREEGKILEDLAKAERELAAASGQRDITRRANQRGQELQKQANITEKEVDTRNSNQLSAELEVTKNKQTVASLHERRSALEQRFQSSVASFDRQILELTEDAARIQSSLDTLEPKLRDIERQIQADRDRAIASRDREVEAVEYDIIILGAEKTRLTELGQVQAPFGGRVVYRNPAPGLASDHAPILAISAGSGFLANIRLPRRELQELASQSEPVQLALDTPVLHQFFTGRFVRAEPVPFEPDRVIAYFECSLPPEIISLLGATAGSLRVRLLWRPSLIWQRGFQIGSALLVASLFVFAIGARNAVLASRRLAKQTADRALAVKPAEPITVTRAVDRRPSKSNPRGAELRSIAARFRRRAVEDSTAP